MAFNGTGSLVFIDDIRADKSSRMNSEVYRDILSAQIQPNAAKLIGRRFIVQMDNDPKHTAKATQEFMSAKKWNILQWPSQSPDLNPIEHAFHLLKSRLKTERPTNKQDLKAAAVKAWQSIKKEETQHAGPSLKIQTVPEMKENTQVTLRCSIDYYCPFYDMSLTWLQDLNGDVKMYTKNDTSGISVTTTLTFLPSWKDHSKNVSCVLHRTNEETDSRTIQLDVKYAPRNVKVVVKPDTKQLKEGTEVTFECIVNSSNPEVTYIAWYQNNKFVVTFSKKKSILAKDAGTYMCEASNEIGRSSSNKVSVEVLYPPKNSKCTIVNSNQKKEGEQVTFQCQSQQNSPKNVTIKVSPGNSVTENTKVQLNCTANAPTLEKLTYSWYHNDQPLLKYQKEYALESIQMDHAGEYYCVVYNDVGSSKSQVLSLHVLYSSSTIGMYAASGIVSLIILMIFVALIIRFGLKTCRNTESSDLSFFVLKKPRSELSDQLDQHASSEDSLERINYASLQFPASINGRQSQSRAKANHPDPDPNDIYSVLKKPKSTLEYENIGSSKKTQDESQDEIHYAIIPNLNRGTTVRERGPETEYAMLKKC
ncbi:unnamed protein product [Ranitomeya imitator]|uniref:Ig-like domain-containing protein n=1 Tax=Ranitomeya imitator TaxID=111125 RepID=A0ABN9LX21_9NEOB|nr:unnamed protein product [Ranitomeya imitator]